MLLDCGEGTQRQMVAAHIGFSRVKLIFITHLHGDHVLGVPGLLQSMTLQRREEPLAVYGPRGLHAFLQGVSSTLGGPGFPVSVHEICEPGIVHEGKGFSVEARRSEHRLESWSYAFVENPRPGRFYPDRAKALGVPEGALWKRLQDGEEVEVDGESCEVARRLRPAAAGDANWSTRETRSRARTSSGSLPVQIS